jgi:hypothetical protein
MRRSLSNSAMRCTARVLACAALGSLLLIAVLATPALAVDADCRNPKRTPDPYPAASNVIRFCTPSVDADGHPLGDGSLRSCEVLIEDHPPIVVPASDPATIVVVQIPEDVKHVKAIDVRCTNDEGRKGLSLEAVATFRSAPPGRPVLLLSDSEE